MTSIAMDFRILAPLLALMPLVCPLNAELLIKDGQTVAFMGDSITAGGASSPTGYVRRVEAGLAANGIRIKTIGAGVSGHKSNQMLERLQKDVIDKDPDWMTLSCGVNDVWHGDRGVALEDYQKNITEIIKRCTDAGIQVVILTATPIKEEKNELNTKLEGYNAFLRTLAKERKLPLADLNAMMWKEIENPGAPLVGKHRLTSDGVHMNPFGDAVMAEGVLRAFGLTQAHIDKAQTAWQEMPATLALKAPLTMKEYRQLAARAAQEGTDLEAMAQKIFSDALKEKLK